MTTFLGLKLKGQRARQQRLNMILMDRIILIELLYPNVLGAFRSILIQYTRIFKSFLHVQ
jgi:hypothetical protein